MNRAAALRVLLQGQKLPNRWPPPSLDFAAFPVQWHCWARSQVRLTHQAARPNSRREIRFPPHAGAAFWYDVFMDHFK